jgi:hypothetical protein
MVTGITLSHHELNRLINYGYVVRSLGALVRLQQQLHRVDERGRCSICRTIPRGWRRWPKHTTCIVDNALSFYLHQPERFVLSVITENTAAVGSVHEEHQQVVNRPP